MTTPGGDTEGIGLDGLEGLANYDQETWVASESARIGAGFPTAQNGFANWIGSVINMITTGISDLVSAFFGNYTGNNQEIIAYQSAQMELNDRLDLLDDVSGYASAFMGSNMSVGSGGHVSDATSGEKFTGWSRIGPQKHAIVKNDGIEFTEPGTWRIDAHMTRGETLVTIGSLPSIALDIQVWGKDGNPNAVIDRKMYSQHATSRVMTMTWSTTVVLPPEYFAGSNPFVVIRVWHTWGGKLLFGGGSSRSGLSVNRWDLSTDGPLNPNPEVGDL